MKHEDALKLKPGRKVIHRRYGVCIVKEIITEDLARGKLFGVVVKPANQNGQDLLRSDLLEGRSRRLSIEKCPVGPGEKPIDHELVWGIPKEDMPPQEPKNHFAPEGEGVPE